jgi:predicted signal transduction protein with EAL and GGDEF domain
MKIIQQLRKLGSWYARQGRTVRDQIVMGAIGFPLYLLAVWYDTLDLFLVYTNEPQSDAIDWLVILFVFLGVAAKIYSVRRTVDLQREVVARRKAQAEAHQMARHDVLTGLPNRRRFIEDFNGSVVSICRPARPARCSFSISTTSSRSTTCMATGWAMKC